jgi:hypothetical protein
MEMLQENGHWWVKAAQCGDLQRGWFSNSADLSILEKGKKI